MQTGFGIINLTRCLCPHKQLPSACVLKDFDENTEMQTGFGIINLTRCLCPHKQLPSACVLKDFGEDTEMLSVEFSKPSGRSINAFYNSLNLYKYCGTNCADQK
jgi:hypothetical protein